MRIGYSVKPQDPLQEVAALVAEGTQNHSRYSILLLRYVALAGLLESHSFLILIYYSRILSNIKEGEGKTSSSL